MSLLPVLEFKYMSLLPGSYTYKIVINKYILL